MYGYEVRTTTYTRILCDRCAANCERGSITTIELPGGQATGERGSAEFCRSCLKELFGPYIPSDLEPLGSDEGDQPDTGREHGWRPPRNVDVALWMRMYTTGVREVTTLLHEIGDLIEQERRQAAGPRRRA